eukprot:2884512-Alexandrium_andersonii.AAC.1
MPRVRSRDAGRVKKATAPCERSSFQSSAAVVPGARQQSAGAEAAQSQRGPSGSQGGGKGEGRG